jgi:pimeloyl-ACP methyl ester carboxylesterase
MSSSIRVRRAGGFLALWFLLAPCASAQQPKAKEALKKGGGPPAKGVTAPSRVLVRGDSEILTFESDEDYDRLQELERTTRDTQPEPGTMTPLYFRSRTDGSVQPYGIRLPRDVSRDQAYPLVVQLHGLNFMEVLSGSRVRYRGMGGPQWIEPDLKVIYLHCFGRPSTFYRGMGEEDVLEAVDEVKRRFRVDADRVFIMGHSMGGSGSYTVGLHYPDQFGGIMPIDAAMGSRLGAGAQAQARPVPAWMAPQVAIHNPSNLYPNARNVDVFFKNAGAGIQGKSTEFTDGIVEQGGFSTAESFPGMPHNFGDSYAYAHFVTELIQHPIRRKPSEVKFYTNTLRYNRAYWVTIDRLTRHNADARVVATCDEKGGIQVTTSNIDALTLRLDDTPTPKGIPLVVDGGTVLPSHSGGVVQLSKVDGAWKPAPWNGPALTKKHGLQGPIDDAFNSRFLAVYGEGDRDLAIAELDALRNPPTVLDIHGDFPMKPASRVTAQDVDSANLILFGTPESNAVLGRIAPSLPPTLLQTGDDGSRAIFIYPNPENPSRYVVVWPAKVLSVASDTLRSVWIMPVCALPDYLRVKDGTIVSGGHFDSDWRMSGN